MNLRCRILGHRWSSDGGRWPTCTVCCIPYEYAEQTDAPHAPMIAARIERLGNLLDDWAEEFVGTAASFVWKIKTTVLPENCHYCGKQRWVAGEEVGNHDRCDIPF